MKVLTHSRILAGAGLVLIGAALAPPSWYQAAGLDLWSLPTLQAEIAENTRISDEMDEEARALTHRIAVKDRLVKDLVEGRTSLATVTVQFHAINSNDPEMLHHLRGYYHVESDRELCALNVLAFAETYLDGDQYISEKPGVLIRLDREFDELFPVEQ